MQDERMKGVMYVSDATCNTEFGQNEDTLRWYDAYWSPVQDFARRPGNDVEVIGCSFYNSAVERYQEFPIDPVFEIARWEKTLLANGEQNLRGFVCGAPLTHPEEMNFLAYGDAGIGWLPYICFSVRL